MIYGFSKAPIKRFKHSSSVQGGEDIISKLPEGLLIYILSLLPDPLDAIRTCVLSKTWKHLWVFLPDLYFVLPKSFRSAEQVKTFHDSVDNALALRGGMLVRRFFLSCSFQKYDLDHGRLYNSLTIAAQSKLEILELNFPTNRNKLMLWWDFLKDCSTTLVELTLKGVCVLDVGQAESLFPCLKKVKLTSVDYMGDQLPQNLISCCPVLQELCLEKQSLHSPTMKSKIASPYLKRLRIRDCRFGREILIEAPTLEYLYIKDDNYTKYSVRNPLSLVEAHIDKYSYSRMVVELLTCVSVAKRLALAYQSLSAIFGFRNNIVPMFPNLVKLDVDIQCRWELWNLLFNLLHKMPLLEQFTISYRHLPGAIDHRRGMLSGEAPTCLRFMMKEITILNKEVVTQKLLNVIRYLLRHSTVLKRLTLNAHDIDQKTRQQLLNFHRGSHMCRIKFV